MEEKLPLLEPLVGEVFGDLTENIFVPSVVSKIWLQHFLLPVVQSKSIKNPVIMESLVRYTIRA